MDAEHRMHKKKDSGNTIVKEIKETQEDHLRQFKPGCDLPVEYTRIHRNIICSRLLYKGVKLILLNSHIQSS